MARKSYTDEFRRQAVVLYKSTEGATLSGIAVDRRNARARSPMGRHLRRRHQDSDGHCVDPLDVIVRAGWLTGRDAGARGESQAARLARLEARVRELETETTKLTTGREILRSAAKYLAGAAREWLREVLGQQAASVPPPLSKPLPFHPRLAPDGPVSERRR